MGISSEAGRGLQGRWPALGGVVFVILTVVAIVGVGGDTPDGEASAAKVASFYNAHDTRQAVGAFILAAAIPFLVIFGVTLSLALRPAGTGVRTLWQIVLAGGTVLAAGAFLLATFIHFALADGADTVTASTLQALNTLDADTWIAFNTGLGVMMLGAAGSLIPRSGGWRTLGWIALVLGVALFIPFADFFALLLTGIWIIVVSVMLYRSEPAPA